VGCSAGPALVGLVSDTLDGDLKRGMLAAILFPVLLIAAVFAKRHHEQKH